jgi:UDP-N-acetylglucosamine diphosphorylase/glucosamine-1-phosphate N-acetyltransferase
MNKLSIIVLAAGKGTRMQSDIPKVLHKVNGKSMIKHVLGQTHNLKPEKILVVIGYEAEQVKKHLENHDISYALQLQQHGTAHAVMQCESKLNTFKGSTLILSGDVPLIKYETLQDLYNIHISKNAHATILSAKVDNSYGYGRIIRQNNNFVSIVEEKDANNKQKEIKEINGGIYIFDNKVLFDNINKINNDNNQSEYYLPDIMPILIKQKYKVLVHQINDKNEIKGANTYEQLSELEEYVK